MQKKILALAVAGLMSGAAFAQSNVTVYGVVDAFYGQHKATAAAGGLPQKQTVVNTGEQSGSRIGFRGTEDLGNGLKAIFTLEYGLTNDATTGIGAGGSLARQQFVGLQGGWGTFVAGRLQSPGFNFANKYNNGTGGNSLSALAAIQNGAGATINMGSLGRVNNGMAYVSPKMNGLSAVVAYTTGGENDDDKSDRIFGMSVDYDNGPMSVSVAHHNITGYTAATANGTTVTTTAGAGACPGGAAGTLVSNVSTLGGFIDLCRTAGTAEAATKQKENAIGGSYDFGVAKVVLSHQTVKISSNGVETTKNNVWSTGVAVPVMGNGSVRVGYSRLNDKRATDNDAKAWNIGYIHSLSKRTSLYGGYAQVKNDNTGRVRTTAGLQPSAGVRDGKSRTFGIGMTHTF